MKVVINACFGGFGLSPEATLWLWEKGCEGIEVTHVDKYWPPKEREETKRKYASLGYEVNLEKWREYLKAGPKGKRGSMFLNVFTPNEQYVLNAREVDRHHPLLIQVVEEMGEKANGGCAALKIVEIPDDVEYVIDEYDGNEHIAEKHRTWL